MKNINKLKQGAVYNFIYLKLKDIIVKQQKALLVSRNTVRKITSFSQQKHKSGIGFIWCHNVRYLSLSCLGGKQSELIIQKKKEQSD